MALLSSSVRARASIVAVDVVAILLLVGLVALAAAFVAWSSSVLGRALSELRGLSCG